MFISRLFSNSTNGLNNIAPYTAKFLVCYLTIFISACAQPTTQHVAQKYGYTAQYIQTSTFKLASYQKLHKPVANVNIYIEGDGHVTQSNQQIAKDPSPHSPLTMQLAALDPNPNVVYLARPCQYSPDDLNTVCNPKLWTTARYSNSVVEALNEAITQIKLDSGARDINLIGYSGGGALAVLIAARRTDIASIRTVAGNLDLIAMQDFHNSKPLNESLDPLDYAKKVRNIPQLHFIGAKDRVIPSNVSNNFRIASGLDRKRIIVLPKAGHNTGWTDQWPGLLKHIP